MILFVAAIQDELGALPGEPLGVGPVVVAARMGALLVEHRPAAVVMVGTAGAYPGGPAIGVPILARRVGLSASVAAMGLGYVPRPPPPLLADRELLERLKDVDQADVLTVNAITTDPVLAGRLSDGWQVEHMEAYGAACACAQQDVPFLAILGIANRVGPDAHSEWLVHQKRAQDAARAVAMRLRSPAPG